MMKDFESVFVVDYFYLPIGFKEMILVIMLIHFQYKRLLVSLYGSPSKNLFTDLSLQQTFIDII